MRKSIGEETEPQQSIQDISNPDITETNNDQTAKIDTEPTKISDLINPEVNKEKVVDNVNSQQNDADTESTKIIDLINPEVITEDVKDTILVTEKVVDNVNSQQKETEISEQLALNAKEYGEELIPGSNQIDTNDNNIPDDENGSSKLKEDIQFEYAVTETEDKYEILKCCSASAKSIAHLIQASSSQDKSFQWISRAGTMVNGSNDVYLFTITFCESDCGSDHTHGDHKDGEDPVLKHFYAYKTDIESYLKLSGLYYYFR